MNERMMTIDITVNGTRRQVEVEPEETLLEMLRNRLDLTGTKKCCGVGECGACTVILDGKSVNSCIVLAAEADGSEILTIEGIAEKGKPGTIQQAFLDAGAVQCGFCTPGMVMSAHYLLTHNPNPGVEEILEGLSGNLCRCTGYGKIVEAVRSAASKGKG